MELKSPVIKINSSFVQPAQNYIQVFGLTT